MKRCYFIILILTLVVPQVIAKSNIDVRLELMTESFKNSSHFLPINPAHFAQYPILKELLWQEALLFDIFHNAKVICKNCKNGISTCSLATNLKYAAFEQLEPELFAKFFGDESDKISFSSRNIKNICDDITEFFTLIKGLTTTTPVMEDFMFNVLTARAGYNFSCYHCDDTEWVDPSSVRESRTPIKTQSQNTLLKASE